MARDVGLGGMDSRTSGTLPEGEKRTAQEHIPFILQRIQQDCEGAMEAIAMLQTRLPPALALPSPHERTRALNGAADDLEWALNTLTEARVVARALNEAYGFYEGSRTMPEVTRALARVLGPSVDQAVATARALHERVNNETRGSARLGVEMRGEIRGSHRLHMTNT